MDGVHLARSGGFVRLEWRMGGRGTRGYSLWADMGGAGAELDLAWQLGL